MVPGRGRPAEWRRAGRERRDRRSRHRIGRARRASDRRPGLHPDARPGRHPLAHVDDAAAQHVRQRAASTAIFRPPRRSATSTRRATCTTARCCRRPRRCSPASPRCTTGATTSSRPEHAEEDLRALQETGIRGRFCYGPARRMPFTEAINVDDLTRFARRLEELLQRRPAHARARLARRAGARSGCPTASCELRPLPEAIYRREHDAARSLGLPISVHLNSTTNRPRTHHGAAEAGPAGQGPADHPRHLLDAGGDEGAGGRRRRRQRVALFGAAHRLRRHEDPRISRPWRDARRFPSTPRR